MHFTPLPYLDPGPGVSHPIVDRHSAGLGIASGLMGKIKDCLENRRLMRTVMTNRKH
jgi:hypothetical protein